jgi:hypothetical protein
VRVTEKDRIWNEVAKKAANEQGFDECPIFVELTLK